MTREEFAEVAAYLKGAYSSQNFLADEGALKVWYHELGELPTDEFQKAARAWVKTNDFPPSIAGILRMVYESETGGEMTPAEAWCLAQRAVRRFGWMREEQALASLPSDVSKALRCFGYRDLCESTNIDVARAQFERQFTQIQNKEMHNYQLGGNMLNDTLNNIFALTEN